MSVTWTKLLGETVKFLISHRTRTATNTSPTLETTPGRGIRCESVGAEASAATVEATLAPVDANVLLQRVGFRRPGCGLRSKREPKWRNWQTRRTQNPVPSGACGFDSHLRHRSGT